MDTPRPVERLQGRVSASARRDRLALIRSSGRWNVGVGSLGLVLSGTGMWFAIEYMAQKPPGDPATDVLMFIAFYIGVVMVSLAQGAAGAAILRRLNESAAATRRTCGFALLAGALNAIPALGLAGLGLVYWHTLLSLAWVLPTYALVVTWRAWRASGVADPDTV